MGLANDDLLFVLSLTSLTINITSDKLMPKPHAHAATLYISMILHEIHCSPWRQQLRRCRGVTSVASAQAGDHGQRIYSVGADTTVCTVDVVTGKLQQRFRAGKHALTCVKAASGLFCLARFDISGFAAVVSC